MIYESAYLVLYSLPVGVHLPRRDSLLALLALLPHTVPRLVVVVMVSTFLSTIYHIGHPSSEVLGAFILGLIPGTITAITGSFLYALFHHALVGHPEQLHCVPRPYAARSGWKEKPRDDQKIGATVMSKKILMTYLSTGLGHLVLAQAIAHYVHEMRPSWDIRIMNAGPGPR